MNETFYDVMRRQGITHRSFLKFCSLTAASLGLSPAFAPKIAHAMETKPRIPVLWLHGLECTCCSESFIRPGHPLAKDVILSMLSLDYDDTIMAAAGHNAEAIVEKYKGNYILAVEGNAPLAEDGMYCIIGGKPFVEQLKYAAESCKAIISWGSCASWGCVQAAKPNPTRSMPTHKIPGLADKPIIKVPGCPPIAEVMTAVVAYLLTFETLPTLDRQGRPQMFYSQRIHDKCYRRPHFDAGQFVEHWDDEAARQGHCLYKMGCKGPTTYIDQVYIPNLLAIAGFYKGWLYGGGIYGQSLLSYGDIAGALCDRLCARQQGNPLAILFMHFVFVWGVLFMIVTGFALYSEGAGQGSWQHALFSSWVLPIFDDSQNLHSWHHLVMWLIVCFVLIHIYVAVREDKLSRQREHVDHDSDRLAHV